MKGFTTLLSNMKTMEETFTNKKVMDDCFVIDDSPATVDMSFE